MSDVEDDARDRSDEMQPPKSGEPDAKKQPVEDLRCRADSQDDKSLSVVIPEPKSDANTHTIVVGPCSPSDGERSPSGSEMPPSGIKSASEMPENLSQRPGPEPETSKVETNSETPATGADEIPAVENVKRENNNIIKKDEEAETKSTSQDDDDQSRPSSSQAPSLSPTPLTNHVPPPNHVLFSPASMASGMKEHLFGDLPTRSLPPTFLASHHDPIFSLQAAAAEHRSRHNFPLPFSL